MAKTFKEMVIERLERMTEVKIDDAFENGHYDIAARTASAKNELEMTWAEYETALKLIEDNFE